MRRLLRWFRNRSRKVCRDCAELYREAKEICPDREEHDYLKFALLSLPPYDYQYDRVIEAILNTHDTIEKLEEFLADSGESHGNGRHRRAWEDRETNLSYARYLIMRNEIFFQSFRK